MSTKRQHEWAWNVAAASIGALCLVSLGFCAWSWLMGVAP